MEKKRIKKKFHSSIHPFTHLSSILFIFNVQASDSRFIIENDKNIPNGTILLLLFYILYIIIKEEFTENRLTFYLYINFIFVVYYN